MRNRGTLGGNVCTNDPTNHLPPLLAALDAQFTIAGADGERTGQRDEFFLGVYLTAVGPGELLTRISVPAGRADGFAAVTLGVEGTCIVSAAASVNGSVRVALGCVDAVPVVLEPPSADADAVRAAVAGADLDPPSDVHASADYRRHLAAGARRTCRRPGHGQREELSHVEAGTIPTSRSIAVTVNGTTYEREVEARKLLIHFIRDDLDLTGSHIGCDTGNCGACSVIVDGTLVKSCMLLAVQADGSSVETVEGLADGEELTKLQQSFTDHHALQCGYCTPGMLMSATALLRENPHPSERRDQEGPAGQHLPLHRLLEHLRGGQGGLRMSSTTVAPEQTETAEETWKGQSVPRKEDRRLVQGQGVFVDDIKRHGMGFIHFVRSPYAHAHITSIDVSQAERMPGVYGTLTGEEVASLTDPFFQTRRSRREPEGLRAGSRQGALRRRGDRRGRRRDP